MHDLQPHLRPTRGRSTVRRPGGNPVREPSRRLVLPRLRFHEGRLRADRRLTHSCVVPAPAHGPHDRSGAISALWVLTARPTRRRRARGRTVPTIWAPRSAHRRRATRSVAPRSANADENGAPVRVRNARRTQTESKAVANPATRLVHSIGVVAGIGARRLSTSVSSTAVPLRQGTETAARTGPDRRRVLQARLQLVVLDRGGDVEGDGDVSFVHPAVPQRVLDEQPNRYVTGR